MIQNNFFNLSKVVYIEPEFIFNGKILGVLPTSPQQRAEENVNFPIAVHSLEILENAIWQGKGTQGEGLRGQRRRHISLFKKAELRRRNTKELLSSWTNMHAQQTHSIQDVLTKGFIFLLTRIEILRTKKYYSLESKYMGNSYINLKI